MQSKEGKNRSRMGSADILVISRQYKAGNSVGKSKPWK
jgi:hypothetical protein